MHHVTSLGINLTTSKKNQAGKKNRKETRLRHQTINSHHRFVLPYTESYRQRCGVTQSHWKGLPSYWSCGGARSRSNSPSSTITLSLSRPVLLYPMPMSPLRPLLDSIHTPPHTQALARTYAQCDTPRYNNQKRSIYFYFFGQLNTIEIGYDASIFVANLI